jgi:hypothetical protein
MKVVCHAALALFTAALLISPSFGGIFGKGPQDFQDTFNLDQVKLATTGKNAYFILEPGYQLVLIGWEKDDSLALVITVLNTTEKIGKVTTRVVEEKETVNGEVSEISRNYYAFCPDNGSIFYFGESVDLYEEGKVVGHEGSWRADQPDCLAGLMMPGIILPGSRYFQEIAPKIAEDRAEIITNWETLETPAGKFENVLKVEETSALEPKSKEYKYYAPGVGLIQDGKLLLVKHGVVK